MNLPSINANFWIALISLCIVFAVLTMQIQKVSSEKKQLEEENEELKNVIDKLEESNANINNQLNERFKKIEELKEENKELNNEIDKKDKEIKRLKKAKAESKNKVFNMNATHYSAFCPTGCTGKTAIGVDVSNTIYHKGLRVIAVDPKIIPLGSKVRVAGDGYDFEAWAIDTGGDIKGNRIDILVGSTKEAYKLGRKNVQVEIIN